MGYRALRQDGEITRLILEVARPLGYRRFLRALHPNGLLQSSNLPLS